MEGRRLGTDGRCAISEQFIEITPAGRAERAEAGGFEVLLKDGKVVRVPERFEEESLLRLLAVLRRC
jgi:hypothetical protein